MTLLEKMDRLVYATHLDHIVFMKMQPRNLRWSPLLVIVGLVAGYTMMVKTPIVTLPGFWIGWLLYYGAFLAACFVRAFGPRFTPTVRQPLDERELMIKARAHAISGVVVASCAMFGCFYMASAGAPFLWHPHTPYDWINLGFGVQAGAMLLPTLVASWLQPRPSGDGED
ncbi:MAG: hypothetical protein JWL96_2007 [Sphingomonas bacterium]|uniref:hypothetical protein n=1 Tax=Sphingomonas bacterium TaxID=1895847 RepID=UPI0026198D32|nr:hypothetical protein [Sphingomonas bacterium]MDB5709937.1 hypothetical protein [Sphingomonas bacterium]